jgi:hypothetical protein
MAPSPDLEALAPRRSGTREISRVKARRENRDRKRLAASLMDFLHRITDTLTAALSDADGARAHRHQPGGAWAAPAQDAASFTVRN